MKHQTKGKEVTGQLMTNKKKAKQQVKHIKHDTTTPKLTDDEKLFLEIKQVFNMPHDGHSFNIFLMMKNIKAGVYITHPIDNKKAIVAFCKKI